MPMFEKNTHKCVEIYILKSLKKKTRRDMIHNELHFVMYSNEILW